MTEQEIVEAAEAEGFMSMKEAIAFLGETRTNIYELISEGKLVTRKSDGRRRRLLLRTSVKKYARELAATGAT